SHSPGILSIIKKLGFAYDQQKKYSEARGYFNYALSLGADDPEILMRLDVYKAYIRY
ncbi:MAG: tetratricopeptide repeat protein, partial [bacterium]|nr:tetratricopeptide repeat protein [bacterium]